MNPLFDILGLGLPLWQAVGEHIVYLARWVDCKFIGWRYC
jgi:hypothetical protein